ncbi:Plasma membrane ATPase, partial [Tolypocladium paradoxum]
MPVEIPGYYYDEAKKKYFKIEKSHTAPSSASWSSDSVKKRKAEDATRQAARHRAHLVRNHIKRHGGLGRDVVASGLLAREAERRR